MRQQRARAQREATQDPPPPTSWPEPPPEKKKSSYVGRWISSLITLIMLGLCRQYQHQGTIFNQQSELKLSQHLYVPHYAPTNTEKDANWQRILDMRAANVDASATPTPSPQTQTPLQLWSHWHQSPHPLPTSWQELPIDPDNHPIVGNDQEHELIPVGMPFRKTNGSLYTRGKF